MGGGCGGWWVVRAGGWGEGGGGPGKQATSQLSSAQEVGRADFLRTTPSTHPRPARTKPPNSPQREAAPAPPRGIPAGT
nr:hypothetical protein KitaXyl93_45290 [Kitasatospora sp. Xyl93]